MGCLQDMLTDGQGHGHVRKRDGHSGRASGSGSASGLLAYGLHSIVGSITHCIIHSIRNFPLDREKGLVCAPSGGC